MSTIQPPQAATMRAIAPDLARGLMLLLIALANIPWSIYGLDTDGTSPHGQSDDVIDQVWQSIAIITIDSRSYPLFAFLFGYGIWQLYARQRAAGVDPREARRLLQRRHWWMLAFGAVHALLLWFGDIVGAYGIVGLVVTWLFLDRQDRTLRIWAWALTGLLGLWAITGALSGIAVALFVPIDDFPVPSLAGIDSYPWSMLARLGTWLAVAPFAGLLGLAVPVAVLVAILAARRGVLEQPEQHLAMLKRVALGGILIGWVGGVPTAAMHVLDTSVPGWAMQGLHSITGLAGGLGYAAAFGLLAARISRRGPGPVTFALTAVGKRSLSSYLAQSVLIVPALSAWGFGLGATMTEWQGAIYAVGVWLVTVVIAVLLERAGRRGPAEWLLRRLAYRDADAKPTPVARLETSERT